MDQCEQLRKYNRWRRGDGRLKQPDPKALGELIEGVADRLEVLEREHSEFFERWHEERRKREKLAHDIDRLRKLLQQVLKDAQAENVLPEWWHLLECETAPNTQ